MITADDVAVSLAVREDLGPQHEAAVIAEFLDRVGDAIDQRVDAQVEARVADRLTKLKTKSDPDLAIVSLALGIPLTAIAMGTEGLAGALICWGGIALVNIAHALRRH